MISCYDCCLKCHCITNYKSLLGKHFKWEKKLCSLLETTYLNNFNIWCVHKNQNKIFWAYNCVTSWLIVLRHSFCLFIFEAIPNQCSELFQALNFGITPHRAWGNSCDTEDQTGGSHVQSKYLNAGTISQYYCA